MKNSQKYRLKQRVREKTADLAVLRDVTELKRVEEEQVAAVRERRGIIDAMPDALFVLDTEKYRAKT